MNSSSEGFTLMRKLLNRENALQVVLPGTVLENLNSCKFLVHLSALTGSYMWESRQIE